MRNAVATAWLSLLIPAWAATNLPACVYPSDMGLAVKLGNDLYQTLDARCQRNINPAAFFTEQMDAPEITPMENNDESNASCQVLISTGFISLMNHVAHAKAIDRIQPGYFQQYAVALALECGGGSPSAAPNMVDARYWSEDVMNDQAGLFNQMVGFTMAINLSHHYLGHYQKYAGQMSAGKLAPINDFITPSEWDASVKAAAINSLDCALGTEGAIALFEVIDNMPRRPAWTGYIVPMNIGIKKLNTLLTRCETAYFHAGMKLNTSTVYWRVTPAKGAAN